MLFLPFRTTLNLLDTFGSSVGAISALALTPWDSQIGPDLRAIPPVLFRTFDHFHEDCYRALHNCVNLRSCTWTRDGTFATPIIHALQSLSHLEELEFNGASSGKYDPSSLVQLKNLKKVRIIMPDWDVIAVLPLWMATIGNSLNNLSIISKVKCVVKSIWIPY